MPLFVATASKHFMQLNMFLHISTRISAQSSLVNFSRSSRFEGFFAMILVFSSLQKF